MNEVKKNWSFRFNTFSGLMKLKRHQRWLAISGSSLKKDSFSSLDILLGFVETL
jgi:hypothetical protein